MIQYKADDQGNMYVCVKDEKSHIIVLKTLILAWIQVFAQKNWEIENPNSVSVLEASLEEHIAAQKMPVQIPIQKWTKILDMNSPYGNGRFAEQILCGLSVLQNAKDPKKLKVVPSQPKIPSLSKINPSVILPTVSEVVLRADQILSSNPR